MQTCIVKYNRKGDSEHVEVANFTFVKIVRTMTWTEPGKNRHPVDVVLIGSHGNRPVPHRSVRCL